MPALFRRREVWLPTAWGWLALAMLAGVALWAYARMAYDWLAQTEPLPGASVLVVEGWVPLDAMDQVVAALRRGAYRHVIVSGGPVPYHRGSSAEAAMEILRPHLPAGVDIMVSPTQRTPRDRSYQSALDVGASAREAGIAMDRFDVMSPGAHARRSRMVYRLAFEGDGGQAEVGVLSARLRELKYGPWWATSEGGKSVVTETVAVAWTWCCFRPEPPAGTN